MSKSWLSWCCFCFARKNISKRGHVAIVQQTIQRESSRRRALQLFCICSTFIMIFFELIPSTNRGGLLAELHRFQSIQLRAGIALTFWNLERWLSGTILVLFYIPKLKNAIFCYKNISLVIDSISLVNLFLNVFKWLAYLLIRSRLTENQDWIKRYDLKALLYNFFPTLPFLFQAKKIYICHIYCPIFIFIEYN